MFISGEMRERIQSFMYGTFNSAHLFPNLHFSSSCFPPSLFILFLFHQFLSFFLSVSPSVLSLQIVFLFSVFSLPPLLFPLLVSFQFFFSLFPPSHLQPSLYSLLLTLAQLHLSILLIHYSLFCFTYLFFLFFPFLTLYRFPYLISRVRNFYFSIIFSYIFSLVRGTQMKYY